MASRIAVPTPKAQRRTLRARIVLAAQGKLVRCSNPACPRTFAPDGMQTILTSDHRYCSGTCREIHQARVARSA